MKPVLVADLIAEEAAGFPCSKSKLVADGIPHLRPFNISSTTGEVDLDTLYRVPADEVPRGKGSLKPGDILFNNTNSAELVGKAALVRSELEYGFSNHVTRLRLHSNQVEPAYFTYWLVELFRKGYFKANATQWVSQAAYRVSDLAKLSIPLPPLSEQRRIVDILDRAAAIQKLRRQAEAKAQEIIPALFVDMFGDPVTNPREWPVKRFGALGQLDRGKSRHRPRDAKELFGGRYPFIQTGDVAQSRGYIRQYTQTLSEYGLAQSRLWPAGTLCITIAANIAATGILQFDACFPDSVVGFTPSREVSPEYIRVWLGFLKPVLEATAPQLAQKNINLAILRELEVPVAPRHLINAFDERVNALRSIAMMIDQSGTVIDESIAALQQGMMSPAKQGGGANA